MEKQITQPNYGPAEYDFDFTFDFKLTLSDYILVAVYVIFAVPVIALVHLIKFFYLKIKNTGHSRRQLPELKTIDHGRFSLISKFILLIFYALSLWQLRLVSQYC